VARQFTVWTERTFFSIKPHGTW